MIFKKKAKTVNLKEKYEELYMVNGEAAVMKELMMFITSNDTNIHDIVIWMTKRMLENVNKVNYIHKSLNEK